LFNEFLDLFFDSLVLHCGHDVAHAQFKAELLSQLLSDFLNKLLHDFGVGSLGDFGSHGGADLGGSGQGLFAINLSL